MTLRLRTLYWWLRDRIFPGLEPFSQDEAETQTIRQAEAHSLRETLIAKLPADGANLESYLASVVALAEDG